MVGSFLLEMRKKSGLEIEDVVGIFKNKYNIKTSYDTLKRVEDGKRVLNLNEAIAISKVYKFQMEELLKMTEIEMFNKL